MSLIRLAIIVLIIWGLYRLVQHWLRPSAPHKSPQGTTQDMVKCAHCGVHVPGNEAINHHGLSFCSVEHRDAGPRPEGQ